jgi:hypothetical protein
LVYRKAHTGWQHTALLTGAMTQTSSDSASFSARRRATAGLAVLAALTLGVSACSGTPNGNASPSTSSNLARGVSFSLCMRDHGLTTFPDPDSSRQFTIDGVANGTSLNPSSPAFTQALSACKSLEPAGFMGQQRTPQQQAYALKFARCMRDNGITTFPDPASDGPIIDVKGAHSIPGFMAAQQKCSNLYAADMGLGRSGK